MSDFVPMFEVFGGVAGGLGLFIAGMHSLTSNLKALASRRLRGTASGWNREPFSAWVGLVRRHHPEHVRLVFIPVGCLRWG